MATYSEYHIESFIAGVLFVFFSTSNAANVDEIVGLTKLFKFSPQSDCLDECVTPLVIAVYDMVAYDNSRTHFGDLCIEHSSALRCFEKNAEQCQANVKLFKLITSGLDMACDSNRPIFDNIFACIDVFRDKPLSDCEKSCHLYDGLSNWTSSRYMEALSAGGETALFLSLRDAATFCNGLSCYFSCAQNHLNFMCGEDGERILELFTRPLHEMANHYRMASPQQKALLQSVAIPDECARTVRIENEDHLLFNEGVLRDVNVDDFFSDLVLDDVEKNKKQDPDSDYFDLSLVNIDKTDRQANRLQENAGSVAYIILTFIFVFLVLFVTLLGLVVTIMWCCVTTTKSRRKMTHALRFISAVSPPVGDSSVKSPARPLTANKEK